MNVLHVKSALPAGQVALWERHDEHPGGEVFIADEGVHAVAGTQAVLAAVARNVLAIVPGVVVEDEDVAAGGDVSSMSVDEALAAVEAGDLDAAAALEAEQAGKNRKSLIASLTKQLEDHNE